MSDHQGFDGDRPQGGGDAASAEARKRRRRSRRSRGKGEPSLDAVLHDAAAGRPVAPDGAGGFGGPKRHDRHDRNRKAPKHKPPHANGQPGRPHGGPPAGRPGANHSVKKGMDRRSRRVRPMGREDEELPARHDAGARRAAENWWADRWLNVLHRFGWKGRLANGRMYADEGRVTSFVVETGRILAKVQGTRTQPYDVTIQIRPLPDADWDLVVDILSCQALFTAQLLAGDMPQDIEEVFEAAYAPLFPRSKDDIRAHCTCPDYANPCKHIAAVYYVMADTFDKDPFVIFQLRGRGRDHLIGMLRAARAAEAQAGPMSVETLDAGSLEPFRFWQAGEELDGVHVQIAQPPFPGATAKRLGRPPFWRSPADPITRLAEVYEAIAQRAREVALNESLVVGRRIAP
jgi:uncharacterized Zn finger protein